MQYIEKSKNKDNLFTIKDSGKRLEFDSGMVRDTTEGKIDYTLALDGPMFKRYAIHLNNGAKKYNKKNWMKASGQAELDRFRESAFRHFLQWYWGETDEDHNAATWFNMNAAEYVSDKMKIRHDNLKEPNSKPEKAVSTEQLEKEWRDFCNSTNLSKERNECNNNGIEVKDGS